MAALGALSELISLRGKRTLITAGIGKAIAYRFAEAGADLELVDIDSGRLAATKKNRRALDQRPMFTRRISPNRKR